MIKSRFLKLIAVLSALCMFFATGVKGSTNEMVSMTTTNQPDPHPLLMWEYGKTISEQGEISTSYYSAISQIIECRPGDVFCNYSPDGDTKSSFSCYHVLYRTSSAWNDTFFQRIDALSNREVVIPEGVTGYRYVFGRSADSGVFIEGGDAETNTYLEILQEGSNADVEKKQIKVLCIGNSFTQDCVAYMPFIAQELTDQVEITLGIAYNHGAGIDDYLGFFDKDEAEIRYNKKSPDKDEWTTTPRQTIRQVLADEDWDVVTFQQNSSRQEDWSSYSGIDELIHDVVSYIAATHEKDVIVGWLMPQTIYRTTSSSSFDNLIGCVQRVMETTPVSFVIPCGTAVHYARQTGLNKIGDGGGLTYEGLHLQEGLPCLLAAYVTTMKILEICGVEYRPVIDDQTRPLQDWVDAHDIPGKNGMSVGVTDENCYLAQKLASKAIMYPYGEEHRPMEPDTTNR